MLVLLQVRTTLPKSRVFVHLSMHVLAPELLQLSIYSFDLIK